MAVIQVDTLDLITIPTVRIAQYASAEEGGEHIIEPGGFAMYEQGHQIIVISLSLNVAKVGFHFERVTERPIQMTMQQPLWLCPLEVRHIGF